MEPAGGAEMPTTAQPAVSSSSRGRNRQRGGRRGNHRPTANGETSTTTQTPSSTAPKPARTRQAAQETIQSARGSSSQGRTRRREHIRVHGVTSTASGRQFSGQLTSSSAGPGPQSPSALRPNAPLFVPGQVPPPGASQQQAAATQFTGKRPAARKNSLQRSTAADLGTRIHDDIAHGLYECSICTSEVRRKSKVWSCTTCWTVFHLDCIEQWSKKQRTTQPPPRLEDGEEPPPFQWRCPGCNLPKDDIPLYYSCWCGKEIDPRSTGGVPPHSCGQTCSKPRTTPKNCPHPCELSCHAGPCPPCSHMGPMQSCFCGKESLSRRCAETDYERGWSCAATCGEMLPCGEHFCEASCHEGLCGSCEFPMDVRCYCGKVAKTMACCDTDERKESSKPDDEATPDTWTGMFDCHATCGRLFDCGIHSCEKSCHAQEAQRSHCPSSQDIVTKCPCGKTQLSNLLQQPRQSCEDSVPCCDRTCGKTLPCGHSCRSICHSDACPPCANVITVACRCGRVETEIICHRQSSEPLMCLRLCKARLSCGRHECGEHCCPGEKLAQERTSIKRKLRPLAPSADTIEAEHICTRICGRKLRCGNHECEELCHKGPCRSCREAIFEEIPCHCGKTVLQPPLPCGTGQPPCRFECERAKDCGHPQVSHNCHTDVESCPKCPFLVEKVCMCKKKTLKNQPCFFTDARCGEVCGKKLKCGAHYCKKTCHRTGDCEDATRACRQLCGESKKACGHPCDSPCHSPYPCKEDKPCQSKLLITCDCQHLKTETKCLALRTSEGNRNKTLKCDDECARLERNRQLAMALRIDPATHQDDHVPYSTETLRLYQDDTSWAQTQERELRLFAADDEVRRMRFKPMKPQRRAFLHALADDFGLDSESIDPEPHRHVCIFKTPKFVKAPMKTLTDCVRIRARTAAFTTTAVQSQSLSADNIPFNAFLLTGPRFALTVEELSAAIAAVKSAKLDFSVEFLPSEEVVLKPKPTGEGGSALVEPLLKALKPAMAEAILNKKMAAGLKLCAVDPSLNVLRRETADASNSGWSLVAARAAGAKAGTRPAQTPPLGGKTTFTVLSKSRLQAKPPKPAPVEVADDWEAEMDKEERDAAASESEASAKVEAEMDKEERGAAASGSEAGAKAEEHDPDHGEEQATTATSTEGELAGSEAQPVAEP